MRWNQNMRRQHLHATALACLWVYATLVVVGQSLHVLTDNYCSCNSPLLLVNHSSDELGNERLNSFPGDITERSQSGTHTDASGIRSSKQCPICHWFHQSQRSILSPAPESLVDVQYLRPIRHSTHRVSPVFGPFLPRGPPTLLS